MAKKRTNSNWGKPSGIAPVVPSAFEREVKRLRLSPNDPYDRLAASEQLRAWAQDNFRSHYVPEKLLKSWGLNAAGLPED
ncbi:MAG TPA: hypothetical protein VFA76_02275 [Terriglobales bacterium]|jgi:hypothetical protein|nr:hypothetical protein [Terriglobales bacterium]